MAHISEIRADVHVLEQCESIGSLQFDPTVYRTKLAYSGCFVKHIVEGQCFVHILNKSKLSTQLAPSVIQSPSSDTEAAVSDDVLAASTLNRSHTAWALICLIMTIKAWTEDWHSKLDDYITCCGSYTMKVKYNNIPAGILYSFVAFPRDPGFMRSPSLCRSLAENVQWPSVLHQ